MSVIVWWQPNVILLSFGEIGEKNELEMRLVLWISIDKYSFGIDNVKHLVHVHVQNERWIRNVFFYGIYLFFY